jgi:hypothetical protein
MAAFCSACGQPLAPGMKFCGQCGAATNPAGSASTAAPPPAPFGIQSRPQCRTCGIGTLRLEKRYRMSTPVVVIGYVLLVPSLFGVLVCVLAILRVATLESSDTASTAVGGILFFFALAALVGGLLGWLLIMKKKVLCCAHCSAIVPAS